MYKRQDRSIRDSQSTGARATPIPEHLHTVTPRLVVGDGRAAIAFYEKAFGAQQVEEPFLLASGEVVHAELLIGDSVVMITQEGAPAEDSPCADRVPCVIMATYWEDVDAACERALRAGAHVIFPLADQFYGERGGRLGDPFSQQWMLSQRIEALTRDQLLQRARGAA